MRESAVENILAKKGRTMKKQPSTGANRTTVKTERLRGTGSLSAGTRRVQGMQPFLQFVSFGSFTFGSIGGCTGGSL